MIQDVENKMLRINFLIIFKNLRLEVRIGFESKAAMRALNKVS